MVDYVKFLMWLPILATPFMVFGARPQSLPAWRIGRLVAAVTLLYISLNLVLYLQYKLEWSAINAFRDQNPECWLQPCEGERKSTVDGLYMLGAIFAGWVLALVYVGLWELAWRARHRKVIRFFEWRDVGLKFSSILVFIALLLPILFYIFMVYLTASFYGVLNIRTFVLGILAVCIFVIGFLAMLMPESVQDILIPIGRELIKIIEQL